MIKCFKIGCLLILFLFTITEIARSQKADLMSYNKADLVTFEEMLLCRVIINRNPEKGNIITTLDGASGHFLYIFNNNGVPVYAKKFPDQVFNLKPQPNGLLTYYDSKLKAYVAIDSTLTEVDTLKMKNGYTTHTHELLMTKKGYSYMFGYDPQIVDMSKIVPGGKVTATVTGLVIQGHDKDKNLVFQWKSWDHFSITDSYQDLLISAIDYVHGNSLYDDTDTTLILSSRNMSEVTKINRLNGDIIWRLGGKNNEFTFVNDTRGFSKQHTVYRLQNGNLLMFDNGVGSDPLYSRGSEYKIDENNLKVELVNEYRHTPDLYTIIKGSIQRLSNGNTLAFWGHSPFITEFDQFNSVTWDVNFNVGLYPTYRAFRTEWEPYIYTFDTDTLNFNIVDQGATKTRPFEITNRSNRKISITSVYNRDNDFSVTESLPLEIEAGGKKTLTVSYSPTKAGYVTDTLNVCYETDSTLINRQIYATAESIANTGIEIHNRSEAVVYPNPGKGIFKIKTEINKPIRIRVFDIYGKTVIEEKSFMDESYILNLTDSPDGLYLIELQESDIKIPIILKIIKFSE